MSYRNKFDTSGRCSVEGGNAEVEFKKILLNRGYEVREATRSEQLKHVDLIATKGEKVISFDIKARKRISRDDDKYDDETVYIEFQNVGGNLGWLYGEADYIAFEREKDFVIVIRAKLIDMAESKCNLQDKVSSAGQCLYKGYTRRGRNDLMSRVLMKDIEAIALQTLLK